MKHRVKVTVLDTLLYEDLQREYCQNPCSGKCPVYNKGDVFVFYREDGKDSFWQCGLNTLVSTNGNPAEVAGGSAKPFVPKLGMQYQGISTPVCRAVRL